LMKRIRGYGEAEGLGDVEVGYEIKFGGKHDRLVGWLFDFEDTVFIFSPSHKINRCSEACPGGQLSF
jgi:hypothetical protein